MAQTLLIYLLISACWGWMFRSSYNSGGFSDAFRHGLTTEGFIDWLHSLNTWPLVVLFCLFLPIPLVVAHRGQATRVPGFIGMGCLFYLMWVVDFWNNQNALDSWIGLGLFVRLAFLAMPVAAVWLGCLVAPCVYHLAGALKPWSQHLEAPGGPCGWTVLLACMAALNLAAVAAGIAAVDWARDHERGPFFPGFWHGSAVFLPAPTQFYRWTAQPIGRWLVSSWTIFVTLTAILIPLRTSHWTDGAKALAIAFTLSGFIGLWVAGDVLFNLHDILWEVLAEMFIAP